MIAATFGSGQVAYSILWFFLFFIEVWLAVSVFIDIFRSHDLKGWAKALWLLVVIVFPLIGILGYFIFRGDKMRAHQNQANDMQEAFRQYAQHTARGQGTKVDELHLLGRLRDAGDITDDEFRRLKDEIVNRPSHV